MAGKDDIHADVAQIYQLRKTLLDVKGIVDALSAPNGSMGRLRSQHVDFGWMDEAVAFRNGYYTAMSDLQRNQSVLSKMLGDLAVAAQQIHDNYQHAANSDTISAKSVQAALAGVETDFHPTG